MRVGYIRVSSEQQSLERQREALNRFGVDKLFEEKVSGKSITGREELLKLLNYVRDGDEVVVHDWSRLSRSLSDLLKLVEELDAKGVRLISVKENFDTSTSTGKLFLTIMGAVNEFERANILERQRQGIEIAKRNKRYKGRQARMIPLEDVYFERVLNKDTSVVEASKAMGLSRSMFYIRFNKWKEAKQRKDDALC